MSEPVLVKVAIKTKIMAKGEGESERYEWCYREMECGILITEILRRKGYAYKWLES